MFFLFKIKENHFNPGLVSFISRDKNGFVPGLKISKNWGYNMFSPMGQNRNLQFYPWACQREFTVF